MQDSKVCCNCKELKLLTDFHVRKSAKDGRVAVCKNCKSIYDKLHRDLNSERLKENAKKYYLENKEQINHRTKQYYEENKEDILIACKNYRANLDQVKLASQKKKYREENKDHLDLKKKEYYQQNSERIKKKARDYAKENKAKVNAVNARRRAAKLNATLDWLTVDDFEEIRSFYEIAQCFKLYTGLEYHVDHIIPLQGKSVCGLHVPWNLQVLEAKDNLSKHSRLDD